MTREEAIQILSTRDAHGVLCGYTSGVTEALDMAIEALSRSGDLISRADAIEAWDKLSKRGRTEFDQVLMTLPSADAVSREECDECKTDKEGVLLQQLAELQGDYETMKNAYEDALADAEWIPCSDRLPEERGFYLVSVGAPYKPVRLYEYKPCEWYDNENLWKSDDGSYCFNWFVEAWMPLPKPYREESEVKK